jgi:hypothetical protein
MGVAGLVDLGEGVEETPEGSALEGLVGWMPPLVEHTRDLCGCDRMAIHGPYHKVVGLRIIDASALVGIHALIELKELVAKLSNSSCSEVAEVSHGVACVFSANPDFSGEGQVVTNKHTRSCNQSCWIGLVVAVPDSHNP